MTPKIQTQLSGIAALLQYPAAGFQARTGVVADFRDEVSHVALEGLQELYTTTFDLNPVATLEVGWHLWGEQYERGRFLAELREKQELLGIESDSELPDHLTLLLPMIERTRDPELCARVLAALQKIAAPLEEHGNPWRHVIAAARAAIEALQGEAGNVHHRAAGGAAQLEESRA